MAIGTEKSEILYPVVIPYTVLMFELEHEGFVVPYIDHIATLTVAFPLQKLSRNQFLLELRSVCVD